MLRYLIVASEVNAGRGARWLNLERFLRIYHGRRNVRAVTPNQLKQIKSIQAETLLIGVPTSLSPEHLVGVDFKRVALFDYQDEPRATWRQSDEGFLRSLTKVYLRPWVEPEWDEGLTWGVLPIRRSAKLSACLGLRQLHSRDLTLRPSERKVDVSFVGTGTTRNFSYNQRIEWLRELRDAPFSFWGGLVDSPALATTAQNYGDISDLIFRSKRIGFLGYFNQLLRSRVALAPAGFARWSYRHYEAIYAGAIPISADFRKVRTLINLPVDGMIHVPDGASVLPAIAEGLRLREQQPELVNRNILSLERVLLRGDYSRTKPELLEVFENQLRAA